MSATISPKNSNTMTEVSNEDNLKLLNPNTIVTDTPLSSPPNNMSDITQSTKSNRIIEMLKGDHGDITATVVDASKSTDVHSHLQGFIVYLIQVSSISVKRRYSEFEALRLCLIKQYPTLIIPPIPEKQSIKSNITQTTSQSLGLATSSIANNSHDVGNTQQPMIGNSGSHFLDKDHADGSSYGNSSMVNLIEHRKRMLGAFLNKCLKNPLFLNSKFLISFLDPEINFLDYVHNMENVSFYKTSIYQLSPKNSIENIENQIYLTLPIPSSSDADIFKELADEEQFQKFVKYEMKFLKYELVLSNISKINKHLVKYTNELSVELSELGASFNQLSILQDSDSIQRVGKLFERHTILLSNLSSLVNVGFLDKLIELKNFSTTCKGLMEYNRKKIIQFKLVEKDLYNVRSRYKRYEDEEKRIKKIERKTNMALRNASPDSEEYFEPPITDEELQTALYSKSCNKTIYGKIPGVSKFNKMILKYVNDPNPDETRRTNFYNLKIRLFQLERQYSVTQSDLMYVNAEVMKHLEEFHTWFKEELHNVTKSYQEFLSHYYNKGLESWKDESQSV